jgi:hypothetical protein
MSKPQWDALVEQLQDPDPGTRRKACERLAATADPQVIPYLRRAYYQEDDERVKQAAHDALASFRALQQGQSSKGLPVSDDLLRKLLMGMGGLFVLLLLANVIVRILPSGSGDDPKPTPIQTEPTSWEELTARFQERIQQAQADTTTFRTALTRYDAEHVLPCAETNFVRPPALNLASIDQETYYGDLKIIGDNLDFALNNLQIAQNMWDNACRGNSLSIENQVAISQKLDLVEPLLSQQSTALQQALLHPAPTYGPTVTPTPTETATTEPSQEPSTLMPQASLDASGMPPISVETATPTLTPAATGTPTATPLPLPDLDYETILVDLNVRFRVFADLQGNSSIIERWQQGARGQAVSCSVSGQWPEPFAFTSEQQRELNRPGVADPTLEETVQLINDGLDLGLQARDLFESSCASGTLSQTAADGVPLAQEALNKLNAAYTRLEDLRNR